MIALKISYVVKEILKESTIGSSLLGAYKFAKVIHLSTVLMSQIMNLPFVSE